MSKYTAEELKGWALEFVRDFNDGGIRALEVILTVSAITGEEPEAVIEHIKDMAR